ncbi:SRSF protein kinase 1 [Homo sapiens]|uniref:SRSF protein kinase 1 n=1 Tax=Homo sapiens TaxID=9606 RepID=D6RDZ3_HUMAN|nr:SRSF protein kinase 1 [Homo sapiens]KAI4018046.1 SRSF protein kinase 1 [Homo sapiens]
MESCCTNQAGLELLASRDPLTTLASQITRITDLKLSTEALLPTLRVIYQSRKRRFWDLMMMSKKILMIIVKEVIIL